MCTSGGGLSAVDLIPRSRKWWDDFNVVSNGKDIPPQIFDRRRLPPGDPRNRGGEDPPSTAIEDPRNRGKPTDPRTRGTPDDPRVAGLPEDPRNGGTPGDPRVAGLPQDPRDRGVPFDPRTRGNPTDPVLVGGGPADTSNPVGLPADPRTRGGEVLTASLDPKFTGGSTGVAPVDHRTSGTEETAGTVNVPTTQLALGPALNYLEARNTGLAKALRPATSFA